MNRRLAAVFIGGCAFVLCLPLAVLGQAGSSRAQEYLNEAVRQMGGETALRGIKNVKLEGIGHREMIEQSERPDGPYFVEYDLSVTQLRDFEHNRWKQSMKIKSPAQDEYSQGIVVADGAAKDLFNNQGVPGSRGDVQTAEETLELGPERILFTALAAPDLHSEPDTTLQSTPHHVVAFTWKKTPVRVFLNANTALPTAIEWKAGYPYDLFWGTWGDVTSRVYFSFWWLCAGGIHYPSQWDYVRDGLPDHVVTINKIDLNGTLADDEFAISADEKAAFEKRGTIDDRPLGRPDKPTVEIVKDVVHIPGAWNVTLVKQSDGVVVIEAPISSGYSIKVLDEVEKRWPGVPVKAAITTSDSWPHLAGVREYVARGIPVYCLDADGPILHRLLAASHTYFPDALQKSPKEPKFRVVSGKTVVGTGPNRLEIYPLRGETSERQMMVYFPEHKLLYGSDPFQWDGTQYFYPQTVWELMHAVAREKLQVDTFFMMHIGPTKWSELPKVIEAATK